MVGIAFNEHALEQALIELSRNATLTALSSNANDHTAFVRALPLKLLEAYQVSPTQIRRIEQKYAPTDLQGVNDLIADRLFQYRGTWRGDAAGLLDELKAEQKPKAVPGKNAPRFLITSNGVDLRIHDGKLNETWRGELIEDLIADYDVLLPLAGRERYQPPAEQKDDVNAARVMRQMIDAIRANDPAWREEDRAAALNTFMTRLIFCLYADDAGIYDPDWKAGSATPPRQPFADVIARHAVQKDGSDTASAIGRAFEVLNLQADDAARDQYPPAFRRLPYVNGDLFARNELIPRFNRGAKLALKDAIAIDWKGINADIFGSMIQSIAGSAERSEFGMHFTSVTNIMKVLRPLFLDNLEEALTQALASGKPAKIEAFIERLANIHIFDPASGSGNFLIIAYRELRRLERAALKALVGDNRALFTGSRIRLDHFHGIDPNDFACRTARLSLWISQIQADQLMAEIGLTPPAILPIHDTGDIHHGSALEVPWSTIVKGPATDGTETYIVGNPPYLGSTYQTAEQKADMDRIFKGYLKNWRNLDFVAAWFKLLADHIRDHGSEGALVTTNSLCQGESVPTLWPWMFEQGVEIKSAHTSFKWRNSAAQNAGVSCAIVALRRQAYGGAQDKTLYVDLGRKDGVDLGVEKRAAKNINAYLIDGPNVIIEKASKPSNGLPEMIYGNKPCDGGHLLMTRDERDALITENPASAKFIKPIMGAKELLHGIERYCLWIDDDEIEEAKAIPTIAKRIEAVRTTRLNSSDAQAREMAKRPHQFREHMLFGKTLVTPRVTSENRKHLVIGLVKSTVINDSAFQIPNAPEWLLGILSTRMMREWLMAVGGKLKTDTRFSSTLVYNTFPTPELTDARKALLTACAEDILMARQPLLDQGMTLAQMYGPDMPAALHAAHQALDAEYEAMCIGRSFRDDAERLSWMFGRVR